MRSNRPPVETIYPMNEILASREPFYVPVSLDTHDAFCFDEREVAEAEGHDGGHDYNMTVVTPEEYIHWAGGILNIPYNIAVVQETVAPGSVTDSFEGLTGLWVPRLTLAGVRGGVHSDVNAEQGRLVKTALSKAVGCGYAGKRLPISALIADSGDEMVAEATRLRPELIRGPQEEQLAHDIVGAHGRLINRDGFFTDGRRVVMTAAAKGAKVMLVKGEQVGEKGVINLAPDTSINSHLAAKAGLPVYNQDSWAAHEANNRVRHLHGQSALHQQIAELIDTIGTMRVLGVRDIVVRRPQF